MLACEHRRVPLTFRNFVSLHLHLNRSTTQTHQTSRVPASACVPHRPYRRDAQRRRQSLDDTPDRTTLTKQDMVGRVKDFVYLLGRDHGDLIEAVVRLRTCRRNQTGSPVMLATEISLASHHCSDLTEDSSTARSWKICDACL